MNQQFAATFEGLSIIHSGCMVHLISGSLATGISSSDSDVDLLVEFEAPDLQPAKRFFWFAAPPGG